MKSHEPNWITMARRMSITTAALVLAATIGACEGTMPGWEPLPSPGPGTRAPSEDPSDTFVMLTTMSDSPSTAAYARDLGFEAAFIVGPTHFDKDHDGVWDGPDGINRYLRSRVPEDYSGHITIDWEGPLMKRLRAWRTSTSEFNAAMDDAVELLRHIKRARPDAKVGYYGLPYRMIWSQDDDWMQDMKVLKPIYDASDYLYPSAYDLYDKPEKDMVRYRTMVEGWLEAAGDKPILIYTHSRYHQSNKNVGLRTIPDDEFRSHIQSIMEAEYNGRRPAGIVIWGEDKFWVTTGYRRDRNGSGYANNNETWKYRRSVFDDERLTGESNDEMLDRLHRRNYRLVHEELSRIAARRRP